MAQQLQAKSAITAVFMSVLLLAVSPGPEAYSVDSGNATCSVSHSGDHGIAETNSRWREGTRFPSFKMRFPTRRIVWRSYSSAVGPAVSSAPPAARLAVLR